MLSRGTAQLESGYCSGELGKNRGKKGSKSFFFSLVGLSQRLRSHPGKIRKEERLQEIHGVIGVGVSHEPAKVTDETSSSLCR